jgi:prepilin-type N-terminal cleavage/methylation domain-containing protein
MHKPIKQKTKIFWSHPNVGFTIVELPPSLKFRRASLVPNNNVKQGFTIVELLVVIVVIGILAAITIVSYTGISQKAAVASLVSDLDNAAKQLKVFQVINNNYPLTNNCSSAESSTNICLKNSGNSTYQYAVNNNTNPQTFSIVAIKGPITYKVTNFTVPSLEDSIVNGLVLRLDAGNTASYPGIGTDWVDLSGNNNNGTFFNHVTYNGLNNGSLTFDGTDDYVDVGNGASLTITNSVTADAWVKTNVNSGIQMIVGKGNDWRVEKVDSNYRFEHRNSSNVIVNSSGNNTSTDWVYIAATYELNTFVKLYINGNLVDSQPQALSTRISSANNQIGNNYAWHSGGIYNDYFFNGYIANVRIYNRALSSTEITQNFNATKSRYGL